MGIIYEAGKDDPGERERSASTAETVGSRRSLLRAAGGGFVLAAGGLLVPEWLVDEAAASDHPVRNVQNRQQKRRQKHRRSLKHRRKARRSSRRTDPAINLRSGLAFFIHNDGSAPLPTQPYVYYSDGGIFSAASWHTTQSETAQPGERIWAHTSRQELAMLIDNSFWLMANNPLAGWPEIYLRYDGKVEPATFVGYIGKPSISGMGFAVGIGPIERTIDGRHFSIMREEDGSYDYQNMIVFSVHVS